MDEAGHGQIPYARMCHFKHCVIARYRFILYIVVYHVKMIAAAFVTPHFIKKLP